MKEKEGFIKLYRQLMESKVFASQTALKIWVWCLLKANHQEKHISIVAGKGERIITVLPGQFIFGRLKAADELDIEGSTVYRWMKKFESDEFKMIIIQANSQYSIVSICNWANYQGEKKGSEQPMHSRCTTDDTYKNDNNDKNREAAKKFIKPSIEEINAYCLEKGINIDENKFFDHYESNGWMVGKVKMKDWKATARKWGRSTPEYSQSQKTQTKTKTPEAWL
ncbi:MAG TPA: hypothetical protein VGK38_09960 [Prolixibacteraceae bacterium]|jgi:hypothetical protein